MTNFTESIWSGVGRSTTLNRNDCHSRSKVPAARWRLSLRNFEDRLAAWRFE